MNLTTLTDTPPWEWPEGTAATLLGIPRDDRASTSDLLLAAELAGDVAVINTELVDVLLSPCTVPDRTGLLLPGAVVRLDPSQARAGLDPDSVRRTTMKAAAHKWEFTARFRRHAFGWRSQPAIQRVKQAVERDQEGRARRPSAGCRRRGDPARARLAGARARRQLLGRDRNRGQQARSPSSFRSSPARPPIAETREAWLERLWEAHEADADPLHRAARRPLGRALRFEGGRLGVGGPPGRHHAHGAEPGQEPARSLPRNGRMPQRALPRGAPSTEIVDLLQVDTIWPYKRWAVKALAALGKKAEAIRYAESCRGPWTQRWRCRRPLRGDPALFRPHRRGVRVLRAAGEPRWHLSRDLPRGRQEVPAQVRGPDPRRSSEDHAGRRGQVVRCGQGGGALRRGARAREPDPLRSQDAHSRRARLRRRRSRPSPSAPACSRSTGSCRATATRSPAPTSGRHTRAR